VTSSNPFYQVFSGPSYASGTIDRTYYPQRGISFSNPPANSYLDVLFSAISGKVPVTQVLSLITGRGDGYVNDIIFRSSGLIVNFPEIGVSGYWHLDEATGTGTYDASGGGSNGTLYAGPSPGTVCGDPPTSGAYCPQWQSAQNCKSGPCLLFNYRNYVKVNDSVGVDPTPYMTLETWFNTETTVSSSQIISKIGGGAYSGYSLTMNYPVGSCGLSQLCFNVGLGNIYATATTSMTNIHTNTWYYAAGTFDGNAVRLYLNGVQIGLAAATGTTVNGHTNYFCIGGHESGIGNDCGLSLLSNFAGMIDEVRVYNRALSAAEILNHYNNLK
jgi:hypothetical protein